MARLPVGDCWGWCMLGTVHAVIGYLCMHGELCALNMAGSVSRASKIRFCICVGHATVCKASACRVLCRSASAAVAVLATLQCSQARLISCPKMDTLINQVIT